MIDYNVLALWVKALRDPKYKQTKGLLCSSLGDNCFCATGLLCQLAAEQGIIEPPSVYGGKIWFDGRWSEPSHRVSRWIDPDSSGNWGGSDLLSKVMNLNDSQGYTFEQIADYLEEKYPQVKEVVI